MKRERKSSVTEGNCNKCNKVTDLVCTLCQGAFYCSKDCLALDLQTHRIAVPICGTDNGKIPAVVSTPEVRGERERQLFDWLKCLKERRNIIKLLNDFTEESIREAIEMLNIIEPVKHPLSDYRVTIIMGDDLHKEGAPCKLYNRACNDGTTLWVSMKMLSDLKPEEIGFPLPPGVRPWTFVILHEFAHMLMGHSYLPDVSTHAKETRADCWATRYIAI